MNTEKGKIDNDVEPPNCCWKFDPSLNRFIILIYVSLLGFLGTVTYDTPASLESQIENTFSIEPYQFEYLYSVYSFPNIVLCFFSGLLVDRIFGPKISSLILCAFYIAGQVVITVGGFTKVYWLMLLGRLIYGIGAESLGVVALYYSALWFSGKEMNFVFGLLQSVGRLGSSFAFLVSAPLFIYSKTHGSAGTDLGATLSLGIAVSLLALILTQLIAWESKRNGKISNKLQKQEKKSDKSDEIYFRDILKFSFKFWLVNILLTTFMCATCVFVSCSQELLMSKFNYSIVKANQIGSVFNIVGALSSPITGIIVDKLGRDLWFITFALTIGITSQIILAFTTWDPFISIIIFAISSSLLNACCWPLTALVVQPYQLATAYGVNQSCINLCLTISNIVAGYLLGKYGYVADCLFYLAFLVVGLICVIFLLILDKMDNGVLNLAAKMKILQRQEIEQ